MKKTYNTPSLSTIQLDMEERILADTTRIGVADGSGDVITEGNWNSRVLSTDINWSTSDESDEED